MEERMVPVPELFLPVTYIPAPTISIFILELCAENTTIEGFEKELFENGTSYQQVSFRVNVNHFIRIHYVRK